MHVIQLAVLEFLMEKVLTWLIENDDHRELAFSGF